MICLNPVSIKNPRGSGKMVVSCGHCLPCRIRKRQEWTLRLMHEKEFWNKSCFVTLTYNNEHLGSNFLMKDDLQNYFHDIRNFLRGEPNRKLKYFACGEYGGKFGRKHYHAIIFGLSVHECDVLTSQFWQKGFHKVENCTKETIKYVSGYVCDKLTPRRNFEKFGDFPPFQLQSQGLGFSWALAHKKEIVKDKCIHQGKMSCSIPRYYLKKLFPDRDGKDAWFYDQLHDLTLFRNYSFCLENNLPIECADVNNISGDWLSSPFFQCMLKASIAKTQGIIARMNARREYKERLDLLDFVDEKNSFYYRPHSAREIFMARFVVSVKKSA